MILREHDKLDTRTVPASTSPSNSYAAARTTPTRRTASAPSRRSRIRAKPLSTRTHMARGATRALAAPSRIRFGTRGARRIPVHPCTTTAHARTTPGPGDLYKRTPWGRAAGQTYMDTQEATQLVAPTLPDAATLTYGSHVRSALLGGGASASSSCTSTPAYSWIVYSSPRGSGSHTRAIYSTPSCCIIWLNGACTSSLPFAGVCLWQPSLRVLVGLPSSAVCSTVAASLSSGLLVVPV